MNSGSSNNNEGGTNNNPVVVEPDDSDDTGNTDDTGEGSDEPVLGSALSCTRNMTRAEIAALNDAVSGTYTISAEFDGEDILTMVALVRSVVYSDDDAVNNEPVEETIDEDMAENLDAASALKYNLPTDDDGNVDLTMKTIKDNYEKLDYTCEAL